MSEQLIYCHICGNTTGPWGIGYWKEKHIFTMMCENCLEKARKGRKNGKK